MEHQKFLGGLMSKAIFVGSQGYNLPKTLQANVDLVADLIPLLSSIETESTEGREGRYVLDFNFSKVSDSVLEVFTNSGHDSVAAYITMHTKAPRIIRKNNMTQVAAAVLSTVQAALKRIDYILAHEVKEDK
jgi:hypothetical protein